MSGSGRDAVEAIADLLSIARLPPGHDPGADYGVATAARQRWHLAFGPKAGYRRGSSGPGRDDLRPKGQIRSAANPK